MAFKDRLYHSLAALIPNNTLFAEHYKRSGSKANYTRQPNTLQAKEIKDWKNGIAAATDPENPRRGDLMRFYQNLLLDNHLASVIDTRILRVQRSSFKLVDDKGNENEELKLLLERPWYEDLIRLVLKSRFQGTTLIELFDVDAESLELECVSEIPQSNFIAQNGLIIKEEYDTNGTLYKEGLFADYYLQVGGDWELGMLNELAMIVLAKKLGLGSWMSYIQKFGVPPIFVTTDRMDSTRTNELFEMLSGFKQNSFTILQGNEKIEIPSNYQIDAHNTFTSLIENVCNKEMSKRVLGGTAMSDEKSFVGSAEVQERVANDRYEADKLLFKYIFNSKIRQRLAKISSVYADFDKYMLVWDNQETLNINGYIDAVQKLSTAYEFDFEEIRNRTGLPITGMRQTPLPTPISQPIEGDQKKKAKAIADSLNALYLPSAATYNASADEIAELIWNNKLSPEDLSRNLVLKYYNALNEATRSGWGKGFFENDLCRNFRENLLKFSGAKVFNLISQIQDKKAEFDKLEDFKKESKKIIDRHNDAWLNTEAKFASNSASTARDFKEFQKDIDIYPHLICRTMRDLNVRPEHANNEGVIKAVGEWTIIPPFDYGCRCWLEQTSLPVNKKDITDFDNKVANNPVFSENIFLEDKHPYFKYDKKSGTAISENTNMVKIFTEYNRVIESNEKKIFVSDFYDPSDINKNIEVAKILTAVTKMDIFINAHINKQNKKNPELSFNKKSDFGDLKTFRRDKNTTVLNFTKNSIESADVQKCKYLVLDMSECDEKEYLNDVKRKLHGEIKEGHKVNIQHVVLIKNKNAVMITRQQIIDSDFKNLTL